MKKLSVLFMGAVMALCLSVPSFAAVGSSQSNLDYAFNTHTFNASPVALSSQEMIETEGEFWFLAPIISAVVYTVPAVYTESFTFSGLAWAAGSGLFGGAKWGYLAGKYASGATAMYLRGHGMATSAALNFGNPWSPLR